ncbi:MAG: FAD-dependent oxidoreductase [Alphaproteobacteria bacterium CG_4_9_14_3_um_filter_47_13]|nr:MAG: FAD-dependent oxidoreductase [Alphaproteobacteria bacterium CG_4_9_14_3_um_filter_47_13]
MQKVEQYETVIIGGGPAGCATAILLAKAGSAVTLLEKEPHETHKICGEFLSWEAVHYLTRLGLDLKKMGAHEITDMRLIRGGAIIETPLPRSAWSISRRALDQALQNKARAAGANIKYDYHVSSLSRDEKAWSMQTNQNTLKAQTVFMANGKHELRGWSRDESGSGLIGFKMHFQLAPAAFDNLKQHVEIILFKGGYAGLEPIENDLANLCFLIEKETYIQCGKSWESVLEWLTAQSAPLAGALNKAKPQWDRPLAIFDIPYGYVYDGKNAPDNLYRLGDQMAVIHSFAGDGMAMALHSGFAAVSAYISEVGCATYHAQIYKDMHRPVRNAQILSKIVLSPILSRMIFPIIQTYPALIPRFFHATRLKS